MTQINLRDLNENFLSLLHPSGVLLVAGDLEKANVMTISWGQLGVMWEKNIFVAYVRPTRFTHTLLEKNPDFTINVLPPELKTALALCGTKSGRDLDKFVAAKLTKVPSQKINTPSIQEARLILECRTIYRGRIEEPNFLDSELVTKFYPQNDFHTVLYGEVVNVEQK